MARKECKHKVTTCAKLKDGTVLVACNKCGTRLETIKGIRVGK